MSLESRILWYLAGLMLAFLSGHAAAAVEISGLSKAQESNVRAWLSINALAESADRTTVYRRHRRARDEIHQALQALGHYRPQLDLKLHADDNGWLARYQIDPGPAVKVRSIILSFIGEGSQALAVKIERPPWQGQTLDHAAYGSFKSQLLNQAVQAGYLDAEFAEAVIRVDTDAGFADIQWTVRTGKRYRFGKILINQEILQDAVIQRYVDIKPGETFSAERLLALQLRLTDLDYFRELDLRTEAEPEAATVDVRIDAQAKAQQRYQFGGGYGTDTGPRFSINNEFRWLNRNGHRLRNDLRLAETQWGIVSQYLIPAGRHVGSHWSLQLSYQEERFAAARSNEFRVRLGRSRLSDQRIWQYYLDYEQENYRVGDTRDRSELLVPGVSLNLSHSDDSLTPRRGYRLFADVHGARQHFASSDSFVQVQLHGHLIWPLGQRGRMLLGSQLGSSFVGEISELPLSQRFFAGGDQSVRGYAYQSLGPRNADGDVIGGKHLSVYSLELDRLLYKEYGAAVFFDFGGASDEPGKARYRGVGLGLRWRSPVGMVRADFAHPLDDPDGGIRVHIGIGGEL